jgi:hypothetical protein
MEKQLDRIAAAFERIAASLDAIQQEGLELWSKSHCLSLDINDMPLPDAPPSEFTVELRNHTFGTKTIPFKVQP